jgi:hypothetical protein
MLSFSFKVDKHKSFISLGKVYRFVNEIKFSEEQ